MSLSQHLVIVPIVLPLAAAALMLLVDERRRALKAVISLAGVFALLVAAIALLWLVDDSATHVYRLGNWPAPFGIVLAADRLSAVMVLLAAVLGSAALVFSIARWQNAGPRFHALVQILLMGVNGAFLTGDLFNLFVFFEVLLAASYGLALHGSGGPRVRASLHYVSVNVAASLLFLVGASLIYAVTGTLNMADLAQRVPAVASDNRVLLEAGAAILGIAFLVKAGMWPLCFWLPPAYSAASAPAAALFAVLTKVGVYVVLRTWLLFFGEGAGPFEGFGGPLLVVGGTATLAFGAVGVLAAQDHARLASYSLLVSSGTLLAAIGIGSRAATGAALYYLVASTLAIGALFLLVELMERGRGAGANILAVTAEAFDEPDEDTVPQESVGIAIPAAVAVLGIAFACCALMIAGVPPLAGFIGKFVLLDALIDGPQASAASWILLALILVSSVSALIGMVRAGVRRFWGSPERGEPHVRLIEIAPVVMLLTLCAALTIEAGPVMRYMDDAAQALHSPRDYIERVLSSR